MKRLLATVITLAALFAVANPAQADDPPPPAPGTNCQVPNQTDSQEVTATQERDLVTWSYACDEGLLTVVVPGPWQDIVAAAPAPVCHDTVDLVVQHLPRVRHQHLKVRLVIIQSTFCPELVGSRLTHTRWMRPRHLHRVMALHLIG